MGAKDIDKEGAKEMAELLRSCLLTLTQLELIQVIGSLIVFIYNR